MSQNLIKISEARLAFPNLWQPVAFKGAVGADATKKRYGCHLVFAPDNPAVANIKGRIKELVVEKFGANAASVLQDMTARGNLAFNTQPKRNAKGEIYDGFEGQYHVSANRSESQGPPDVFDANKERLTAGSRRPYAGCYVTGWVDLWLDTRYGPPRIVATLVAVQFRRDGAAFAGAPATLDAAELDDLSDVGDEDFGTVTASPAARASSAAPSLDDLLK